MNTYTKTPGGWGERLSNPELRLSGAKRPWRSRRFSRINRVAGGPPFAMSAEGRFCLCSPGRRNAIFVAGPGAFSLGAPPFVLKGGFVHAFGACTGKTRKRLPG
jgi:hypothetical protein